MDRAAFEASLADAVPPPGLGGAATALWWARKGDWNRAHQAAQDDPSVPGSAVHAYLHRAEGDLANAGYWYRRAGRPAHTGSLDGEWSALVQEFVSQ